MLMLQGPCEKEDDKEDAKDIKKKPVGRVAAGKVSHC